MSASNPHIDRAMAFCEAHGIRIPILQAPMAGACPPELAIAVADGGGMGAAGTLLMGPDAIADWARTMRAGSNGAFQLNTWIPDAPPARDAANETALRDFLAKWGPVVAEDAGDMRGPDFDAQCEAMLAAGPNVISSIMELYPPDFVAAMKERGIKLFATATTVSEALEIETAGANVIIAQGMEAGGHRGAFEPENAAVNLVGLFALVPAIVDAVEVPVVATGGIADARGIAAALVLGASAVQIGTGLLRTPEAGISPAWADSIGTARPEGTMATRAFFGRLERAVRNDYVLAAADAETP